jgi:PAS domain S-box-containing protein
MFALSLLWLNAVSDTLIALAFFSIPFTLSYSTRKRSGSKLRGAVIICTIIMWACGATYLLAVWNTWHAAYRLEGVLRAIAAVLSIAGALAAIRFAPLVLKMATPKELAFLHDTLSQETEARRAAEEKLRIHTQAQLLASEDKLRLFFESAARAILGVSADGRIALVNCCTEEMFGYSRDELLSRELELLLPERFRAAYPAHRDGYFSEPSVRTIGDDVGLSGLRKDGTDFPIEVAISHVITPEGPIAFGMISDMSERRNAADELRRVNEELRRSNIEVEQFAHVASHDLQEPLRMVTNYLQLIERRYSALLDDDGQEFIRYAVDGAKRMRALIKDLLDFSRAGTKVANPSAVAAGSLLQGALANLKTAIDESGARITADPLPTVAVDPVLITQVFQNLIANAIKFQKDTAPVVHVSAERQGAEWIFSIYDNGIGIEARHLDRIFRIFERLHTTEKYSGSGIGLAIARKIVERHGGRIWVESQPGTGSTFYFSIAAEAALANAAKSGANHN